MSDITLMLQAIDFVEAHLQEEIAVADIAESVSFSLFHFSRTFSRVTRHTPYDYLMRRRLCAATQRLLESEQKIIEIAFDYQFNAPETFSRAFKRVFHIQPRQARRLGGVDPRLIISKLTREYLGFLNGAVSMIPVPVSCPARIVSGIAAQISSVDAWDEIAGLWQLMGQELGSSGLASGNRTYLGLTMFPTVPIQPITYLAGTVLDEGEEAPLQFVNKNIPATDSASFKILPQLRATKFTRQYAHHTWWPKACEVPPPPLEIEQYPELPTGQTITTSVLPPDSLLLPLPSA